MQPDIKLQLALFQLLEEKIGDSTDLIKQLQLLLSLENRSVRNRLRATTYLTAWEFYRIILHYNISISEIDAKLKEDKNYHVQQSIYTVESSYIPLLQQDFTGLVRYIKEMRLEMEKLRLEEKPWIRMICSEVPLFHLMGFKELAYFKIYMYYYHIVDKGMTFEGFLQKIEPYELEAHFKVIFDSYAAIDSVEIWDKHTFEKLLRLIEECQVCGNFERSETLEMLLAQADALLQSLKPAILEGKKINDAILEFYDFESVMREAFILMGADGTPTKTLFKLFMIQNVYSHDKGVISFLIRVFDAFLQRSNAMTTSSNRIKNSFVNLLGEQIIFYRNRLLKDPEEYHSEPC